MEAIFKRVIMCYRTKCGGCSYERGVSRKLCGIRMKHIGNVSPCDTGHNVDIPLWTFTYVMKVYVRYVEVGTLNEPHPVQWCILAPYMSVWNEYRYWLSHYHYSRCIATVVFISKLTCNNQITGPAEMWIEVCYCTIITVFMALSVLLLSSLSGPLHICLKQLRFGSMHVSTEKGIRFKYQEHWLSTPMYMMWSGHVSQCLTPVV